MSTRPDLVLSSGFLAFARHVGVLRALASAEVEVDGICGTSSGALVGSLYAAGYSPDEISEVVGQQRPMALMRVHARPWRGALNLDGMQERLSELLPERFDQLPRPFAVGVAGPKGHAILSEGPLVPAVAASCAIPGVFLPVKIGSLTWWDGAAIDRLALEAWRAWRGERPTLVHLVQRSHGVPVETDLSGCTVLRSARARASFLSLRDFETQQQESAEAALAVLQAA